MTRSGTTSMISTALKQMTTALVLASLFTTGCATTRMYRLDKAYTPVGSFQTLTVGVLPLTYASKTGPDADTSNEVGEFESYYFAARLADTLRASNWFAGVYALPAATPAVDVVVSGHVNRSDGEVTDITFTLRDASNRTIGVAEVGIELDRGDFRSASGADPTQAMWVTAANRIGAVLAGGAGSSDLGRTSVAAYLQGAGQASTADDEAATKLVGKAIEIEREKLLDPVTLVMIDQATTVRPAYVEWQSKTTDARERKRTKEALSITMGVLSVATMGMNTAAVARGVSPSDVAVSNATAVSGAVMAGQVAGEAATLAKAVTEMRGAFSAEMRPMTVKLDGAVYELVGTAEQQLGQMRQIVRKHLSNQRTA